MKKGFLIIPYEEKKTKMYSIINEFAARLNTTNQDCANALYDAMLSLEEFCVDNVDYQEFLEIVFVIREELS